MGTVNNDYNKIQNSIKTTSSDTMSKVAEGAAVTFCGRGVRAVHDFKNGNKYGATLNAAQQTNKLPDAVNDIMGSCLAIKAIHDKSPELFQKIKQYSEASKNPIDIIKTMKKNDPELLKLFYDNNNEVTEFGLFKGTFVEKNSNNSKVLKTICKLDKNLLDTGAGEKVVKLFDKNAKITKVLTESGCEQKLITGNTGAKFAAKFMGRMPIMNLVFSVGLEFPKLSKAICNGDGKQVCKSLANIGCSTLTSAALGAALSPVIPPVGSLIGNTVGLYLGNKLSQTIGNAIDKSETVAIAPKKAETVKVTA